MAKGWSKSPKLVLYGNENFGDGRAYYDPTDGNTRWPSVTSVLKYTPKADLMGWAAMKVAERARDRPDIVMGDPDLVVQRLQYAHTDYRDERGEVGTGVHAKIQADFDDTWDFPDLDEEQLAILGQWERFCQVYRVEILLSEFTVRGDGFMGTADAIIRYTDPLTGETKVALVDFKTSKGIWEEHYMQLSALAHGNYIFQEVPEGTGGAFLRKGKVKAQNSWWVRQPMPEFDVVAAIHLRADFYDFVEVPEVDLHYKKYLMYVGIHNVTQELKEAMK